MKDNNHKYRRMLSRMPSFLVDILDVLRDEYVVLKFYSQPMGWTIELDFGLRSFRIWLEAKIVHITELFEDSEKYRSSEQDEDQTELSKIVSRAINSIILCKDLNTIEIIESETICDLSLFDKLLGKKPTKKTTYDYYINGVNFSEIIPSGEFLTPFHISNKECLNSIVSQMLCITQPTLYSEKIELYICPNCGDPGCGVFLVKVTMNNDEVVWSDFSFEVDYELGAPSEVFETFESIGPFTF